jgi:magnesium chelatase family protein
MYPVPLSFPCLFRKIPDGSILIAPKENNGELALLRQVPVQARKNYTPYVVQDLREAVNTMEARTTPLAKILLPATLKPAFHSGVDFSQIIGQKRAKRALEVAAAGGHNVLWLASPAAVVVDSPGPCILA